MTAIRTPTCPSTFLPQWRIPDFVPLAVFSQYEAAIGDCDKDAQGELRRIMSEFMSTEEYSKQVETYNRLHQMGYDDEQK